MARQARKGRGAPRWAPASGRKRLTVFALLSCSLLLAGCGDAELPMQVIHGTVTCGGEKPNEGRVEFVPIEGTPGPISFGRISNGEYRIDARGGVPVGKHRVKVMALKYTGRQVQVEGIEDGELETTEETTHMEPPEYSSDNSPLIVDVASASRGRIDIEIPAR